MKSSFRVVAGLALLLALLLGLSALTVSAQGPTATPTPAQAPPAAAAGTNLDDPGRAATIGSAVAAIPAHTAQWFRFDYVTPVNDFPRNTVTIRMPNGVNSGLGFEVWSPERMQGNWWDNEPVGRGTQEVLPACTTTLPDGTTAKCTTNDLTWVGGFAVSAPYYIRVVNDADNALAPQMIVGGNGLAQCQNVTPSQAQAQASTQPSNQGFIQIACPDANGVLVPMTGAAPGAAATPAGAATPAAAPTIAPTSTPLATSTPAAAATAAATTAAGAATSAATSAAGAATAAATSASGAATAVATSVATATTAATSAPAGAAGGVGVTLTGLAVAQDAKLGPIVTDSQGRTLYAWVKDTGTTSSCTGSCAQTWPPALASGTPQLGTGLTSILVGTSARSDGGTQVTYNGHPLYYFSGDKNPGDTNGQGVAGLWFTVSPAGALNQMAGAGGTTTPGGTATP